MCEVSIIIVNWNGRQYLKACLDSVMEQTFTDFEVIVVDNGSSDDSVSFIRDNYQRVKILSLDENRGFTGGNCAGFQIAQGQFIALLNNDTRVDPEWLAELVGIMQSKPEVGICASRIIIDGTELIDSVGDQFTTAFTGTKLGYLQPASLYCKPHTVHGGCAAAILYRRSMLDQIGFLDDDFFFNHEDTDLNMRAWLSGWKSEYVPEAIVYHKVSATVGELSDTTVYFFARNNEWVWIKNVPTRFFFRAFISRIIYEICAVLYYCVKNRKWKPFMRGKFDALKKIPAMLIKRRQIQMLVKLESREISYSLVPIVKYLLFRLQKTK